MAVKAGVQTSNRLRLDTVHGAEICQAGITAGCGLHGTPLRSLLVC